MRSSLALLALVASVAPGCARPSPAGDAPGPGARFAALREQVLATSRAYEHAQALTDEAGPRLAGSPGADVAVRWAERAMKEAGLANVRVEPMKVPRWERGEERAEIVAPALQPLAVAALGGSVGTPPGGIEAEVVELSQHDLEHAEGARVAGKIVFLQQRMERTEDGASYGPAVWPRRIGAPRAARLGAVAVVIRSVGTDDGRAPHTGTMRYEDGVPKIPAAALSISDAEVLHRLLASGQRVRLRLALGARTLPDADGANVVGEVLGQGAPGEIVLLGAHLDSWDLGRGALDDGAGCAIVLEAARQIARFPARPRRTVRVVLFANEENGLKGARAYAEAHAAELPAHALAMEADLGDGRALEATFLGPASALPLFRAVAGAVTPMGVRIGAEKAQGGADLIPLVAAGIPVIDLIQDATTYFDVHHTANDTLERIRKPELDLATAAYAAVAYAAADAPGDFGRIPEALREGH